jgi:hypothetical protein
MKVYTLKDSEGILRPQAFLVIDNDFAQYSIAKEATKLDEGESIVLCDLTEI